MKFRSIVNILLMRRPVVSSPSKNEFTRPSGQSCGGVSTPLRLAKVAMDTLPSMAGSSPVSALNTNPVAPASCKTSLTLPPKLGCS